MGDVYQQEMQDYFTQLNEEEKKSVIHMLKTFLQGRNNRNGGITIEQYNYEVEKSLQHIEKGDFISQEDLENEMESW